MSFGILLVAGDSAPSNAFKKLEEILRGRGLNVFLIACEGKPPTQTIEDVRSAVLLADIVLLGMSSTKKLAQLEIAAGIAAKTRGIPYGFYGDIRRCWGRARAGAWFEELAADAAFYCGVTEEDADAAREVFLNAQCAGTGNPIREEMAFPQLTRDEVRRRLNIAPEEICVLSPGGKCASINFSQWVVLMDALDLLAKHELRFQLIIAPHPGDRTPHAIDAASQKKLGLYDELLSFSPIAVRIVEKETMAAFDLVAGADIIVECRSSVGIAGAFQRIPIINLGSEVAFERVRQESGSREIEIVEDGLSELILMNAFKLADRISYLLTPQGFAKMRTRQERLCPSPKERGAALRKIADVIERVIAERSENA